MTPTQLENFIRQRYNAVGDSFYPQDMIFNLIYAASLELGLETKCIKNTYTTTSVSSQRQYDFPTLSVEIRRVEYDGKRVFPNDFLDDDTITGNNPGETLTGTPEHYQVFGEDIYFRPAPNSSSKTIKIFSIDAPDSVTSVSTLSVPVKYHMALVDYVLSAMYSKDNNDAKAAYHQRIWEASKASIKRYERQAETSDAYKVVKNEDLIDEDRLGFIYA